MNSEKVFREKTSRWKKRKNKDVRRPFGTQIKSKPCFYKFLQSVNAEKNEKKLFSLECE